MKKILSIVFIFSILINIENVNAQKLNLSIGTDIPYQFFVGAGLETEPIDISYRTGILVPPYSDMILSIIESLGTAEVYINLLDVAYDRGWMNSIGAYYKFPGDRSWYIGAEFRLDQLAAKDSVSDLVEAVIGIPLGTFGFIQTNPEVDMGLTLYALGIRLGKSFEFFNNKKHRFKTEISIAKHLATQSSLHINGQNAPNMNAILDEILWEDVFKKNGYVFGMGLSYSYTF
jgi:hypothetical protein